jgi:hypothetical protein
MANLASESPEMLGLTVQKREKKRETTSEDDEKRRRRGGQAKLGANADHVSEEEEEIILLPHVRTNIYDPLPNQFQLNGEPFDFTSLRGKVSLFANVASN